MSLQYEKTPGDWKTDVFETLRTTLVVLCPIAFATSGVFALLGYYVGAWVTSPEALPYWLAVSGVLGLLAIFSRKSAEEIALAFGLPLIALLLFHLKIGALSKTSAVLALVLTGALADSIGTHYLYWLTAHPRLQVEERKKRRIHWWLRFISWPPFVGYPLGFGVLWIYLWLYTKHSALWVFWFVPALAVGWSLVWSIVLFNWRIWTPLLITFRAYQSWLSWGRWEGLWGSKTPGLFRSPFGPYAVRLVFTGVVFVLIAAPFLQWMDLDPRAGKSFGSWLLHLVESFFLPIPVVFATVLAVLGPHLAREREAIRSVAAKREWQPEWMGYSNQLMRSKHKLEREHFWLGVHAEASYPVLAHDKAISEHAHILGDSGSGKTHRGLIPLLTQIIRRKGSGVVIIDLKGDEVMFQTMKAEAERHGLTFKWFTNIIGRSSYVFNPFAQVRHANISVNQICELFLDAMRLSHGDGYGGRSYYTRVAQSWLFDILQKFPKLKTFDELYEKTAPEFFHGRAKQRDDCYELVSILQSLASIDQLNFGRIPGESEEVLKNGIFMPDVIKNNEVVYFYLPSSQESGTVREIANLAIFTLYTASVLAKEQKQAYLVIDEFPRVASRAFEGFLQQSRSAGLAVLLANQSLADLKTQDAPSLAGVVRGNTRLKLCFSATEPELQEELIRTSGETVYADYFYETNDEVKALQREGFFRARVGPRANVNDVLRYSASEEIAIARLSRDSGYTQFGGHWFPIITDYAMSLDTFYRRKGMPWPKGKTDRTIKSQRISRRYLVMVEKKDAGQVVLGGSSPREPKVKAAPKPVNSSAVPPPKIPPVLPPVPEAKPKPQPGRPPEPVAGTVKVPKSEPKAAKPAAPPQKPAPRRGGQWAERLNEIHRRRNVSVASPGSTVSAEQGG